MFLFFKVLKSIRLVYDKPTDHQELCVQVYDKLSIFGSLSQGQQILAQILLTLAI